MVAEAVERTITYVTTTSQLRQAYRDIKASKIVAYDIETTGLDPLTDSILLVQFAGDVGPCYVIRTRPEFAMGVRCILELLGDGGRSCIAHSGTFEYQFTYMKYGIEIVRMFDTMLAENILTAGLSNTSCSLGNTVRRRLGITLEKGLQKSFIGADPATFIPSLEQIEYAAHDVALLHDLRDVQLQLLTQRHLRDTAKLEFEALPVFARMELTGMKLDLDEHARVLKTYEDEVEKYGPEAIAMLTPYWKAVETRKRLHDQELFAAYQLAILEILPGGRKKKDTTDEVMEQVEILRIARDKVKPEPECEITLTCRDKVLVALAEAGVELDDLQADTVAENAHRHPVLEAYARWSKANKVVSTYGQSLRDRVHPHDGRVHGEYHQMVSTGRTSSSKPNMQNIPPAIRECFIPEVGKKYIVADFKNQELRIAAAMSEDPNMLSAFHEGKDLHQMTAAAAWPERFAEWTDVPKDSDERKSAKVANFACIYGGSPESLYYGGQLNDLETAKAVVEGISRAYPRMWAWINAQGQSALRTYYALTARGRRRHFDALPPRPGQDADKDERKKWYKMRTAIVRAAMNHPIQGTAADITKRAMILIDRALPEGAAIVGMVHDEVITESRDSDAEAVAKIVAVAMVEAGAESINPAVLEIPGDVHVVAKWAK